MGITIHYRGTVDDLNRVEELEDRVVDLALAMGGKARIWRSVDDATNSRMIRGLILELAPGLESTSLLVSPEGHLINLFEIEHAEKNPVTEPPWCFCKTQFGNPEAHVALVELLTALKQDYISNLEVSDEGKYWETRDFRRLTEQFGVLGAAIDAMAEGLRTHGLSPEAAEDPDIVATRIGRIAALVHETMQDGQKQTGAGDADFEERYRQNEKRLERMQRVINEEMANGATASDALEKAIANEGLAIFTDAPNLADADDDLDEFVLDDEYEPFSDEIADDEFDDGQQHPLQRQASDLLLEVFRFRDKLDDENNQKFEATTLLSGLMEMVGGLAQSCGSDLLPGIVNVQRKRALRGIAFAQGAIYGLLSTFVIPRHLGDAWLETLQQIDDEVHEAMINGEQAF